MNGAGEDFPRCAVCSKPAGQICGGCRLEHYCGRAHQKSAWRSGHRGRCRAFRLEEHPEKGRHMVATRDIKQGETILKENPALVGPKMHSFPTCLTCYKRVRPTKDAKGQLQYYKCTSCGWPMCNLICQTSTTHEQECELMTSRKYKSTITYTGEEKQESAYCVITPLRFLLQKKSNPQQYEAMMNLEDHLKERIDTPLYRVLKANMVTFIQQILGLTEFDDETILKTAAILDTNAFDIRDARTAKKLRSIYLTATMMNHDCNPNTKHIFINEKFCVAIIATVDIPKGTTLSISYSQPLWGTLARRQHLLNVKCFLCTCERCKDPTEFGTFLGSIFCSRCNPKTDDFDANAIPKLVSTDPLNSQAPWVCQVCGHSLQGKQMVWGNEAIRKDISALDKSNPREFESFLVKYKLVLHPTNYHMMEVKYALCQMYGHLPGYTYNELNDADIARQVSLCTEVLGVLETLCGGWSRARGDLLLELQTAMLMKTRRELQGQLITKSEAQNLLAECMAMLQEATEILKSEPDMQETLNQRLQSLALELDDVGMEDELTTNGLPIWLPNGTPNGLTNGLSNGLSNGLE